ncbi:MAG: helix-turn-helix domain-containing protein [Proteobacteria bacterium]|nr:helix-turn-helix domain-containing protein [Pseudomonadota bacterium]
MNSQLNTTTRDQYLTTSEAAEFLGLKKQTLCNWRTMRIGPSYVVLGRRAIRYRSRDLQKYADERIVDVEMGSLRN